MEKDQLELERKFELAVRNQTKHHFDISKPYMNETDAGYDSPFTNHALWGFQMGLEFSKTNHGKPFPRSGQVEKCPKCRVWQSLGHDECYDCGLNFTV